MDNQPVNAGDMLLTIDHESFEAALQSARVVAETQQQKLKQSEHEAQRRITLGAGASRVTVDRSIQRKKRTRTTR